MKTLQGVVVGYRVVAPVTAAQLTVAAQGTTLASLKLAAGTVLSTMYMFSDDLEVTTTLIRLGIRIAEHTNVVTNTTVAETVLIVTIDPNGSGNARTFVWPGTLTGGQASVLFLPGPIKVYGDTALEVYTHVGSANGQAGDISLGITAFSEPLTV